MTHPSAIPYALFLAAGPALAIPLAVAYSAASGRQTWRVSASAPARGNNAARGAFNIGCPRIALAAQRHRSQPA